jgi:transketolase
LQDGRACAHGPKEDFAIGRCNVLRHGEHDRALIVARGVAVVEALTAYQRLKREGIAVRVIDLFSVQPIDREELVASTRACAGIVITVEDHHAHGGLGDSVLAELAKERVTVVKLAVTRVAHSGKPEELLQKFGISASHIVKAVTEALGNGRAEARDGDEMSVLKNPRNEQFARLVAAYVVKPLHGNMQRV